MSNKTGAVWTRISTELQQSLDSQADRANVSPFLDLGFTFLTESVRALSF